MRPLIHRPTLRLVGGFAVLSLAALPTGAGEAGPRFGPAVDWSLTGTASTSSAVDLNRDLDPDETSDLLSTTRFDAGLSLGARTKRAVYTVDLGLAGRVYLGPDQPSEDWPVDPRFAASAVFTGKRYEFSNSFSFDVLPTAETQFDDTGIITDDALQLSVNYSTSLALQLGRSDRLTLSGSARVIDFIDGGSGLVPTRTFTAGLGWDHTLDARTDLGLDLSYRDFTADNVLGTHSQSFDVGLSFSQQRTRRHKIGLSLGPSFVLTERGRDTEFDLGANGSATFDYTLKDLSFGLSLSQAIEPSSLGELQSFTRAGAQASWQVNAAENLTFSLDLARSTGVDGGDASNRATARASYNLTLTREARLSFGYQFRAVDDIDGFATGHQVFLTLSHDFTLLP